MSFVQTRRIKILFFRFWYHKSMALLAVVTTLSVILWRLFGDNKSDRNKVGKQSMKIYREEFVKFFPTILTTLVARRTSNPRLKIAYDHLEEVSCLSVYINKSSRLDKYWNTLRKGVTVTNVYYYKFQCKCLSWDISLDSLSCNASFLWKNLFLYRLIESKHFKVMLLHFIVNFRQRSDVTWFLRPIIATC